MSFTATHFELDGLLKIEGRRFDDDRGWFMETWRASSFRDAGVELDLVQDNLARSEVGVIRGLHYQLPPHAQAKLVRAVHGRILDVAVDLRRDSPTFGRWAALELSGDAPVALLVPHGFAHGYQVLSETAVVAYRVDAEYAPEAERSLRWNDPDVGVAWREIGVEPKISPKDRIAPLLSEIGGEDLFRG